MEEFTIDKLIKELDIGYQVYFMYLDLQYLVYKTNENCYSLELKTIKEKNPHPVYSIITLIRLKEMFPFMSELEYRVS